MRRKRPFCTGPCLKPKFRRRLFSGPYTPPEEASYCFVAMTGEREHFFLDLYCTEDKVTLQVQTSSGTYQAIDPEKIYDVLAPISL